MMDGLDRTVDLFVEAGAGGIEVNQAYESFAEFWPVGGLLSLQCIA